MACKTRWTFGPPRDGGQTIDLGVSYHLQIPECTLPPHVLAFPRLARSGQSSSVQCARFARRVRPLPRKTMGTMEYVCADRVLHAAQWYCTFDADHRGRDRLENYLSQIRYVVAHPAPNTWDGKGDWRRTHMDDRQIYISESSLRCWESSFRNILEFRRPGEDPAEGQDLIMLYF